MARLIKSTGDLEVTRITPGVALGFLKEQRNSRSGYSANRDRKNLAAAWRWGKRFIDGFPTTDNPFLAVDKFPEERNPRYVPAEADFWRVLEVAQGQDRVMLTAFLYTAARRDELFRLTWADVDFKENVLLLRTRKTRGASWRVDPLPILPELRQALVWWWDARPFKSAEHVFTCLDDSPSPFHDAGGRFKYRQHVMRKLCKRAGVKPFGFHAIRHLRAIMLYKGGALVHEVQKWLRHESASTTERYLKSLGCDLDRLKEAATRHMGQGKIIPFAPNGRTPGIATSEGSGYPPVYPLANEMATEM
ncbi:tyrosine-type recombinase/integrase [Humidesulfovibrio sp.]